MDSIVQGVGAGTGREHDAGDQPRPKTLIRPNAAQPAQSSQKRLQAEILNRARKTGKPDDVAATLLVSRKKA